MKVIFAGVVLCDGSSVSPTNLVIAEQRDAQVAKGTRWRKSKVFDRGNKTTQVSFEINLEHASLGVAEVYMATHPLTFPNYGTLELVAFDGTSVYLAGAEAQSITGHHIGVTTIHNYAFTGGEMAKKK